MDQVKIVKALREEAAKNPVSKEVLEVWHARQRARSQVTVEGLQFRMKSWGVHHANEAYYPILKLLADLGLGTLKMNGNKVLGLYSVKVSLQSIGAAALGKIHYVKKYVAKAHYTHIKKGARTVMMGKMERIAETNAPSDHMVSLILPNYGKKVQISVPEDMSAKELAELLNRFQEVRRNAS